LRKKEDAIAKRSGPYPFLGIREDKNANEVKFPAKPSLQYSKTEGYASLLEMQFAADGLSGSAFKEDIVWDYDGRSAVLF
jgi:hypothetical protein